MWQKVCLLDWSWAWGFPAGGTSWLCWYRGPVPLSEEAAGVIQQLRTVPLSWVLKERTGTWLPSDNKDQPLKKQCSAVWAHALKFYISWFRTCQRFVFFFSARTAHWLKRTHIRTRTHSEKHRCSLFLCEITSLRALCNSKVYTRCSLIDLAAPRGQNFVFTTLVNESNSGPPCLPSLFSAGTMARYQMEIGVDGKADLPFTSGPKPMALSQVPCTSSTRRRPARYRNRPFRWLTWDLIKEGAVWLSWTLPCQKNRPVKSGRSLPRHIPSCFGFPGKSARQAGRRAYLCTSEPNIWDICYELSSTSRRPSQGSGYLGPIETRLPITAQRPFQLRRVSIVLQKAWARGFPFFFFWCFLFAAAAQK